MTKRDIAIDTLKRQLGLPYKWGGNDPMAGFDCSGLIVEVLQSAGILKSGSDYTADMLSKKFEETDVLAPGNLVFWDWNNDGRIDHVQMIAFIDEDGEIFTVGASGGGPNTNSEQDAIVQNAYVKLRPLIKGYTMVSDPFGSQRS